jgi:putative membrane protein (TIGR04086 family)
MLNKFINYLKSYLLFFIILFIYLIIISLFNYFEILPNNILNIINYIFILLLFLILGFKISKLEQNKGYLNGFLISLILITIFSIMTLIIDKIDFSKLVYFLTLIASSITGGIIGIQRKKS